LFLVEHQLDPLGVLLVDEPHQVLGDPVQTERDQDPPAQILPVIE
jgi:hypothetical protein